MLFFNDVLKFLENHYYAFGLKHKNYNVERLNFEEFPETGVEIVPAPAVANATYNYKYNGKELQDEMGFNIYDYHFRMYDPAIGRMLQIDPHASSYGKMSPYVYAFNCPTLVVDPDGRDGKVTGTGTKADPYVVTANYYYYNLNADQEEGFINSVESYNNKGKAFKTTDAEGKETFVQFKLSHEKVNNEAEAKEKAKADVFSVEDSEGKITSVGYGNTVTDGPAGGVDPNKLADTNNNHMNIDSSKTNNYFNSPNPDSSLSKVYKGICTHELGHSLGGVHKDQGSIMKGLNKDYKDGSGLNSVEVTTFNLPEVNTLGVSAIIGRAILFSQVVKDENAGYDQKSTRSFGPEKNSLITEGSVGRLVFITE